MGHVLRDLACEESVNIALVFEKSCYAKNTIMPLMMSAAAHTRSKFNHAVRQDLQA